VGRGHAVGAVRADDGQIGHPDSAVGPLLDKTHAPRALLLPGKTSPYRVEEAAIDLEDNLQVTRQQHLEPRKRPLFESFGQQGVIGVGQCPLRDVPGLVPPEMLVVQQDPHQLRYRQCRVRVVQLDRNLVRKRAPVGIGAPEAPHQIGQ